ncbi:hypothetical protein [Actinoplanes sp. NPDC026623]|uniref:hypothetical protein n=1 Tax=Actinoplanes sp. NPDC026623 TaxID=3155610 RepID=UPI0033F13F72
MPANLTSPVCSAGPRRAAAPRTGLPAAVAVDLGSSTVGVWAAHRGTITGCCWSVTAPHPDLTVALSTALGLRVHRAASPRTTALHGLGLAAMSLLRHPAQS